MELLLNHETHLDILLELRNLGSKAQNQVAWEPEEITRASILLPKLYHGWNLSCNSCGRVIADMINLVRDTYAPRKEYVDQLIHDKNPELA